MPHWIYSEFFKQMTSNVTMVVLNGPSPLTGDRIEEIADAIAVDRIGFFAHSSTDRLILDSPRVGSVVLCDPVVFPQFSPPFQMFSSEVSNSIPFLILRAGQSYISDDAVSSSPIPDYLGPSLPTDNTDTVTFYGMGHADLLDDKWADLGASTIPWMRGPINPTRSFQEWTFTRNSQEVSKARRSYRRNIAQRALEHFLGDEKMSVNAIPERRLEETEDVTSNIVSNVNDIEQDIDGA
tara:strand:+ start:24525 stop:25238 length:714 start_codon:yes stop_codon:yes gene_type:complete